MERYIGKKHLIQLMVLLITFSVSSASCQEVEEKVAVDTIFHEAKTLLDQSYGDHKKQSIDIYLPADRSKSKTKVILLIHGGGWVEGQKEDMTSFVPYLQEAFDNKYAIVNMSYRLVNDTDPLYLLPNQTDDINSVMDYIEEHSDELGVKAEFVNLGVSAGAHLAMLYAYKFDAEKRVKTVVNLVGPTDLSDSRYTENPERISIGLIYIIQDEDLPAGMTASEYASPITWINKNSCPTISFFGDDDFLVPNSQSEKLEDKLTEHNVPFENHIYKDGKHDIFIIYIDDIISKTKAFINTHVK